MPRGRPKNPDNETSRDAIAYFLRWADRFDHDDPVIAALRKKPTAESVRDVIEWAEQQNFPNVAAHMRHALQRMQ